MPELQVHQKRGRLVVVQDEIRHQGVDHVRIDSELSHGTYSNKNYCNKEDACHRYFSVFSSPS